MLTGRMHLIDFEILLGALPVACKFLAALADYFAESASLKNKPLFRTSGQRLSFLRGESTCN